MPNRRTTSPKRSPKDIRRERKETRRFATNVSLGIVLVGGLIALVAVANKWMAKESLRTVRIVGSVVLDTAEILKQAALPDTARVSEVDLKAVEGRVAEHPFIRSVSAYYGGDGRLVLEVEERSPVAAAVLDDNPVYLDVNGIALPFRFGIAAPDVPILSGIRGDEGERFDSAKTVEAIGVAQTLNEYGEGLYRRVAEIRRGADGEYTLILTDGGVPVLAGSANEIGPRLPKLEGFLRQVLAAEGAGNAEQVDLRWVGQVVVRWKNAQRRA